MTSGEWLTDHPVLLAEWDSDRNPPLDPALFRAGSSRRVWWHCARGHHWQAVVNSRTRQGAGCPVCSGRRASATNNLAVVFPEVAATWDTPRNDGVGADHVAPRSSRRAAWRCAAGHEWTARVLDQIQHPDCQFCAGKKLTAANSLAALHPELAAQWHPTGNGALTPADVRPNTVNRGVGWLCPHCGHSWRTSPRRRAIEGRNCPECARAFPRRASNPITMTDPKLAAQWHPTRNGAATPDHITYGSHRLVWWQCPSGTSGNRHRTTAKVTAAPTAPGGYPPPTATSRCCTPSWPHSGIPPVTATSSPIRSHPPPGENCGGGAQTLMNGRQPCNTAAAGRAAPTAPGGYPPPTATSRCCTPSWPHSGIPPATATVNPTK